MWGYALGALAVAALAKYFQPAPPSSIAASAVKQVPFYDTTAIQTPSQAAGTSAPAVSQNLSHTERPVVHNNFMLAREMQNRVNITQISRSYPPVMPINGAVGDEQRIGWATATPVAVNHPADTVVQPFRPITSTYVLERLEGLRSGPRVD